jgi:hypothetical protein
VALWNEGDFQALTPPAKLALLALSTGTLSNMAGIGFYYPEALARETGLTGEAIEAALGELEKRPSPARSFVVRDLGVVWVRDLLRADPAREGDPEIKNPKHRTAIETILASLPRDSMAVKKFRDSYHFRVHTPSHTPPRKAAHGASKGVGLSPDPDSGFQKTDSGTCPAFDAFWTAYPRHEAKQHALKAWNALAPNPELCTALLTALEQHKRRLWAQTPPDKIPHAATWLNGKRWEDELPQVKDPYANFPRYPRAEA